MLGFLLSKITAGVSMTVKNNDVDTDNKQRVNILADKQDPDNQGAKVRFPPPLVFIIMMVLAYVAEQYYPSGIALPQVLKVLAQVLMLLGLLMLVHLLLIFKRKHTSIEPWGPASCIITTGYYRYSRNPIYMIFCIYPLGLGTILDSLWVMLSVIPSCVGVYYIAIKAEERYLRARFPKVYGEYCQRVRRWC